MCALDADEGIDVLTAVRRCASVPAVGLLLSVWWS